MRVEIQIKRQHRPWRRTEQASQDVNLQELYNQYWTSKVHELTSQGES